MNRKERKKRLIAEINITPFTDVILVLLIIFMITTPLIFQSSIKVNLPEAANASPVKDKSQVYISITNEGLVYLNKDFVSRKALKENIYSMHKDNPNLGVVLRADKLVRFKDIVSVLDILTEVGIKNLDIAAITEQ